MAAHVKFVAAGLAMALSLPATMLREVAAEVRVSSLFAALHRGVPMVSAKVVAFAVMGSATTSPLQLLVSKRAVKSAVLDDAELDEDAPPAMLRAAVAARPKISSKALNTPRALLCR